MAGWHDATDGEWFATLSANEWILAHDKGSPVITARRAVELLRDLFGPQKLAELVWYGGRVELAEPEKPEPSLELSGGAV